MLHFLSFEVKGMCRWDETSQVVTGFNYWLVGFSENSLTWSQLLFWNPGWVWTGTGTISVTGWKCLAEAWCFPRPFTKPAAQFDVAASPFPFSLALVMWLVPAHVTSTLLGGTELCTHPQYGSVHCRDFRACLRWALGGFLWLFLYQVSRGPHQFRL